MRRLAAMLLVLLGGAGPTARAAPGAEAAPAGSVQGGKQLFRSKGCVACHGKQGEGSPDTRPPGIRIAPPPVGFPAFARYVRWPTGRMPRYSAEGLSDAELGDIYAFLRSAPPQPDPSAGADARKGRSLYEAYGCYGCHGREGQGSAQTAAPQIGPPPIPFAAFAAYTRQPTGSMPPYTTKALSESELADIYAFLRSLPVPPVSEAIPLLNQ